MDPSIILLALQYGAGAIAQGALNEAGQDIYNTLKRNLQVSVSAANINAIERNPNSQEIAQVFLSHVSSASQKKKEELANLAYALLAVIERDKLAKRDSKVDLIVDRVYELFDRHSIDRPTMAEILGVSLSTLKGHGLVDCIDNRKLDELAATFAVSREWLLGSVDYSSNCVCKWNKSPSTAIYRLIRLILDKKQPCLYFVKSEKMDDKEIVLNNTDIMRRDVPQQYIGVVAEVVCRSPSGQPFKCYERWESLEWDYERTRSELLTLVMFCQRFSGWDDDDLSGDAKELERKLKLPLGLVSWRGCSVEHTIFTKYERKKTLLPCDLVLHSGWRSWDIGYYVRFVALSKAEGIILQEYNYVKREYENILDGFARWPEFQKLIANN